MSSIPFSRLRELGFDRPSSRTIINVLGLLTRALPCFTELYNLFIIDGIKRIPVDIINYFDPIVFAFWIMGDGSLQKEGGLILCTECFTNEEVVRLINVLMIKFQLECSIHTQEKYKVIYIKSKSIKKNLHHLIPYIHPTMMYKFKGPQYKLKSKYNTMK